VTIPLRCPHCLAELLCLANDSQAPDEAAPPVLPTCPQCNGVFCDLVTLKALIHRARQSLSTELYQKPKIPIAAPVKYLRCPACDQLMDRHNFALTSGVVIDVCIKHGVWLDAGELAQVLHFCASEQFPDLEKLDRLLTQSRRSTQVIPLDFPEHGVPHSQVPLDQMTPREMLLDVLSLLRLLLP
jgi:Zn-finger nucleic acid-binding protein